MLKCWSYAPENRPTFRYCLEILQDLFEHTTDSNNIPIIYSSWQPNGKRNLFYLYLQTILIRFICYIAHSLCMIFIFFSHVAYIFYFAFRWNI